MASVELSTGERLFLSEGMEYCIETYPIDDDRHNNTITVLAIYCRLLKRCFPIDQVVAFGDDIEFKSEEKF